MLTIRELIKTLYNALIQRMKKYRGNWEQNDPTADDYIKNRPFYTRGTKEIILVNNYTGNGVTPECNFIVGQAYNVTWNGILYENVICKKSGGYNALTGDNYPFYIDDDGGNNFYAEAKNEGEFSSVSISIIEEDIHKLDKKYLPDDIISDLAPVATSGSYNDLTDTPTVYTDVVRYGESQSLTTAQKNQARNNIGAAYSLEVAATVKYNGVQNLTSAQKLQARTNIGAGTSNFSGSYNDLTNKPTIHDVDATLSVEGDAADAKAVGDAVAQLTEQKADKSELEKLNTPKEAIFFIDQINGYRYIACMRDGNFITYCAIKNIEITSMPSKIEYIAGDYFDPTGMVVSAVAYDGTTKEIVDYTLPESYLTNGTTYVEISYIEAGLIYTANVPITVNEFDPSVVLVDFEYTTNDDGTYALTGWKGTYNGEASTEMIIPNNGLIIV